MTPREDMETRLLMAQDIDERPVRRHEEYLPIPADDVLFQGDFIGRYSVLNRLGRGGMGVVYKAYDPQLDRNVALKVLRPGSSVDPTTNEIRLIREAQTLAKLRHPNIVAVYDTGLSPKGVFVAMELVEGRTLGSWLDQEVRRTDEIIRVFREAGKGLAAAHDAGVIHRDFKPANVLIGDDGMVRVLDFGLARVVDSRAHEEIRSTDELLVVATGGEPVSPEGTTTASGALMGTPAYMAPEQLARKAVDERSDQYAFCLCLHLALGGEMPDRGVELDRVVARIAVPPRRSAEGSVRAQVRRALERGLSLDPRDRFESMDALLAELADPPRRWKRVLGASMLGVSFFLGAVIFDDEVDPCADPRAGLQGMWDDQARASVREAFLGSGHAEATALFERVEAQLDAYAEQLVELYGESCHATHVTHERSVQMFDRQVFCLERHRSRVRAAVDALAHADSSQAVLERMVLPFKLPTLEDCTDMSSLVSQQPLPEDEPLRERIAELRRRLDEAQALGDAGQAAEGIERAEAVLAEARPLDYPPLLAEALATLGGLQASGASPRAAEDTLTEAIRSSAKAKADDVAARAWTWLIYAHMYQGQYDKGFTLQMPAEAAVERAGDPLVRSWLLNNLGTLYGQAGKVESSIDYLEQALEVKKGTLGSGHVDVAISWHNLGTTQLMSGHHDEALEAFTAAREGFERTVGAAHPLTHHAMAGLCRVEHARGNVSRALELCDRVLEHLETSPWSDVSMGEMRFTAARTQWDAGQLERSRATAERARTQLTAYTTRADEISRWLVEHPLPGADGRL